MGTKDPRVDAYIAKSAPFAKPILTHLRKLVHANCPEVIETIKWSMPHFDYKGGIFCGMAAFKAHCTFGFWLGDLLKIETKLDKAMGQFGCIKALADLPGEKEMAKIIKAACDTILAKQEVRDPIFDVAFGSKHEHGGGNEQPAQFGTKREAVEMRHHYVEQD